MAAKKVISVPFKTDIPGATDGGFKFFVEAVKWLNKSANSEIPVYADNAAAISGGLSIGDFYHTAAGAVMIVV